MAAIDCVPERRAPIEVAGELVRRSDKTSKQGAGIIRDLVALAKAQQTLLVAYRPGRRPPGKALDTLNRLRGILDREPASATGEPETIG